MGVICSSFSYTRGTAINFPKILHSLILWDGRRISITGTNYYISAKFKKIADLFSKKFWDNLFAYFLARPQSTNNFPRIFSKKIFPRKFLQDYFPRNFPRNFTTQKNWAIIFIFWLKIKREKLIHICIHTTYKYIYTYTYTYIPTPTKEKRCRQWPTADWASLRGDAGLCEVQVAPNGWPHGRAKDKCTVNLYVYRYGKRTSVHCTEVVDD